MNIVITGVSRGIGKELVHQFCVNNTYNVLGISRNKEVLNQLASTYSNFTPLPFDLSNANWEVLQQALVKYPHIDILINNAGAIVNKEFENISNEELTRVYETNVFAPFHLIQQCYPKLLRSEKAHVVNISSMGGFQGASKFPGLSAYSSSKAAIASLTECLAEEFKGVIHVNALCLGAVQTEMLEEAFPGYQAPTLPNQMAEYIAHFAIHQRQVFNGKILPVSASTP